MYTKMNKAINEYINTEFTDYGLMITGDWGCGKTYYLNNELLSNLKNKSLKPIVISLNGLTQLNSILNNVIIEKYLEKNIKISKKINSFDIKALSKASNEIPKIGKIINVISEGSAIYKNHDFKNIILIIDDLERTTLNISEVLGYITEIFINKNVKTIIFGNEKEIINKANIVNYNKIKEKTFRKVIKFTVDDAKLTNTFIASKYKSNIELYSILTNNERFIAKIYSKLDEKNLRTIDFSISILSNILNILYKLKASANIITKIFSIIVALSIEHKKGYLTLSNLEYIKDVKKLNNSYPLYKNITINDEESNEEEIETYIDKFSKKYLEEYHIEYNPIISIIDYITTGFLDEVLLKKELILFYNLDQTLLDKKIIQIRDFKYYSQNKLDKNIDYIFQNLNNFEMIDSLELYSKLIFLKEEVYKDKWKYNDIHERFQIYLKQQTDFKISNDKLFAVILPIKNHDLNYCFKNNLECEKYLEMLNSKYRQIIFKKKKELYRKLFNSIINNENNDFSYYRNKIENFDIDHLFENFVKFDLLDVIPKVNYMLISIFKSFLHYNILRITNAGEYYYSEKKPLQKIKKSFELVDISDVVLQFQINQLILEFNNAILHLEKTKK